MMAAKITHLTLSSLDGLYRAVASLTELAERSGQVRDLLLGLFESGAEICCIERSAAAGAGELTFALYPSDAFFEMMTAIRAIEFDFGIVELVSHGWPILSPVEAGAQS